METFVHAKSDFNILPPLIREYVHEKIRLCQPANVHICDGSEEENQKLIEAMENAGVIRRLRKYKNW